VLGGIEWDAAVDDRLAYFAVSDILQPNPGGLHAVQLATGRRVWATPAPAPACRPAGATSAVRGCNGAQSAAITAIPGVVFSGSNDGSLRAYSATDGADSVGVRYQPRVPHGQRCSRPRRLERAGVPARHGQADSEGSSLVFQVHYTTNGTPGTDRSRVGLIFSKEPPRDEVRTGTIANPLFAIPPGADNHRVEAEASFSEDVKVWSMHPHMHLRGKDMTYTAIYPDGRREIVLRVPKFDFGWQTDYWLARPLALPKGSKLHVAAHFDNSPANRHNPDATATVRWGDQTWEEMMIGFFTYTVEGGAAARAPSASR
jgi:hypothetical protein